MSNKIKLDIISQEEHLLSEEVEMILAPSSNGQIGVLPGHISLFTTLKPGELILISGTKHQVFAISGGFMDVNQDTVTVLANSAIRAEDIDVAKVEAARKRAQEAMQEKLSENDFKLAEADLRKAILELKVAKKRHYHRQTIG
jgi:F-type H+-transporting ATPase subunit epsilon